MISNDLYLAKRKIIIAKLGTVWHVYSRQRVVLGGFLGSINMSNGPCILIIIITSIVSYSAGSLSHFPLRFPVALFSYAQQSKSCLHIGLTHVHDVCIIRLLGTSSVAVRFGCRFHSFYLQVPDDSHNVHGCVLSGILILVVEVRFCVMFSFRLAEALVMKVICRCRVRKGRSKCTQSECSEETSAIATATAPSKLVAKRTTKCNNVCDVVDIVTN